MSSSQTLASLAAGRQTEPTRLTKLVRGELDWIVMKSLEKDRARRYETANGFALDIQRYLAGEPVLAAPPSARYRLRKFARKHRATLTTATALGLLLVAGVAISTWQAVRATRAETAARLAEQDAWQAQRSETERAEGERRAKLDAQAQKSLAEAARDNEARERGYAEAIARFVQEDFLALTSVEGQGRFGGEELNRNATLRELLDRAAEKLKTRKNLAPRTEAELCWIIGVSYRGVGEFARAVPFLERSVALYRQASGPEAAATLNAQNSLALAYKYAGRLPEAIALYEQIRDARVKQLGAEHPDTLHTLRNLAAAYRDAGKLPEAIALLEQVRDAQVKQLGVDHLETLNTLNGLAVAYLNAGKVPEAIALFNQVRDARVKKLGADHPHTLTTLNNLAGAYRDAGKLPEAIAMHEQVRDARVKKLGADHPDTLLTLNNLAAAYWSAKQLDKAVPVFEDVLKRLQAKLGPEHPATLTTMNGLAMAYMDAGKLDLALPLLEESLKLWKAKLGPEHPDTLHSMNNLARAYRAAGKVDLALPLLEESLKLRKAKLGPEHPNTLNSMHSLAVAYWLAKQFDKSIALFEEALMLREAKLGRNHLSTLSTVGYLGVNYRDAGRLEEAIPLLEEAYRAAQKYPELRGYGSYLLDAYAKAGEYAKLATLLQKQLTEARKTLPKDSPQLAGLLAQIGMALLEQKKWTEAEPLLRECLAIREKTQPDAWTTFNTKSMLGGALLGQKQYQGAEPLLLAGYEGMKKQEIKIPPQGKVCLTEAVERLVRLYEATGNTDAAAKWQGERAKYGDKKLPKPE
jgi:eukaryotic-like serine/threonine-protein kinase